MVYRTTEVNMNKVVIKFLQGSVVTQTVLGGLTIDPTVANFLKGICAKIIKKMFGTTQSYFNNKQAYFFWPTTM